MADPEVGGGLDPSAVLKQLNTKYSDLNGKLADAESAARADGVSPSDDPDVKAIQASIDKTLTEIRQWRTQAGLDKTPTPRNPNEQIQADQRTANASGLTNYEQATNLAAMYGHNVAAASANLNYIRGMAQVAVSQDKNRLDEARAAVQAHEYALAQSLKVYQLGLQDIGMELSQQGRQAVFNSQVYGTNVGALEKLLESSVQASSQAVALGEQEQKAQEDYYAHIAPAGTSEYFRQLAMGNTSAARPAGGLAYAPPAPDVAGRYNRMLTATTAATAPATAALQTAIANPPASGLSPYQAGGNMPDMPAIPDLEEELAKIRAQGGSPDDLTGAE